MILQALVRLYESLVEKGELDQPGWQEVKVTHALELNAQGELLRVTPLMVSEPLEKKDSRMKGIPAQTNHNVGFEANFLCDNSTYLLGVESKGKLQRSKKCFVVSGDLHRKLLEGVDHPAAKAVVRFFESWKPEEARQHPALKDCWDELMSGGNLVFRFDGEFIHQIPEIREAWNRNYSGGQDGDIVRCLVTGEVAPIARLHPNIKGVRGPGENSFGAKLVSFNEGAYDSYGHTQGANAPVSQRAAFAYGEALKYLLLSEDHRVYLDNMTLVFWAEGAQVEYANCIAELFGTGDELTEHNLREVMQNLAAKKAVVWKKVPLNPSNRFYILGLAPNASRLAVKFFVHDSFGQIVARMEKHYERLEIVKPIPDTRQLLSVWSLLNETVKKNNKGKSGTLQMSGDLLQAILTGAPYPVKLFSQTELRIRAEHRVSRGRAAIIKAYLLRNVCEIHENKEYEGALQVRLNEQSNYPPYVLGRLFFVLEILQQTAAKNNINATIVDKYFGSACSMPAVVFPQLIRLAQAHLKKLTEGNRINYDRQITDLLGRIEGEYPARLNLHDQGIFQLGYYHQKQKHYEKKEDNENV